MVSLESVPRRRYVNGKDGILKVAFAHATRRQAVKSLSSTEKYKQKVVQLN